MSATNKWFSTSYFNHPLFELRRSKDMSLKDMSVALGFSMQQCNRIENGTFDGKVEFWRAVQTFFDVPDEDMWALINGKEKGDVEQTEEV